MKKGTTLCAIVLSLTALAAGGCNSNHIIEKYTAKNGANVYVSAEKDTKVKPSESKNKGDISTYKDATIRIEYHNFVYTLNGGNSKKFTGTVIFNGNFMFLTEKEVDELIKTYGGESKVF